MIVEEGLVCRFFRLGFPCGECQILQAHYDGARMTTTSGTGRATTTSATNALRSTFILACESPTAVGIGL